MEERKRKSRRILILILAALLLASVCALIWVLSLKDAPKKPSDSATVTDNVITPNTQEQTTVPTESTVPTEEPSTEEPSTEATEPWQPDETLPGKAPTIRLYKRRAEDNAVFQVGSMFPGDVEIQNFCVKISYKESVVVRFRANIRAGYEKLGEVMQCRITMLTTGDVLYEGLMRDMPKSLDHLLDSAESTVDNLYYKIEVSLDTSVGNEYQDREMIADFRWWVEETGNLEPPPTGDTLDLYLWVGICLGSLVILLLLLGKKRKEGKHRDE